MYFQSSELCGLCPLKLCQDIQQQVLNVEHWSSMHCDVPFETVGLSGCNVVPTIVPCAPFVMSRSVSTFCVTITFIPTVMLISSFFIFFAFSCTSHSQTKSLGWRGNGCPLIVSSALQWNIIHPTSPENLHRASSFHVVVPQHQLYLLLADLPSLACLPQGLPLSKAYQYALLLRLIASCGNLLGFLPWLGVSCQCGYCYASTWEHWLDNRSLVYEK